MDKKFTIDGREYADYQLSNEQIVSLIKNDPKACSDDRDFLLDKVLDRFERTLCPKSGETNDDVFARFFSDYVNRCPNDLKRAASVMARDHRYLQNEMFKLCLEYIKKLAEHCEEGCYDDRNRYAAETSKKIIDFFKETNYPY